MKKIFYILLILCVVAPVSTAQNKIYVVLSELEHNFGLIKEENGEVSTTFNIANMSNIPIRIKNVKSSCGCAATSYYGDYIRPGEKTEIEVSYNPLGRYGDFKKSISIEYGNESITRTKTLWLEGKVLPSYNSGEECFVADLGVVKLREKFLDFGSFFGENRLVQELDIYNPMDRDVDIKFYRIPNFISLDKASHIKVVSGDTVSVRFYYDTGAVNTLGQELSSIFVKVDGKKAGVLPVKSDFRKDFTDISVDEFAKRPEIRIHPQYFNLWHLEGESIRKITLSIENRGTGVLSIYNLTSNLPYLYLSKMGNKYLYSGQSTEIEIIIDMDKVPKYRGLDKVYLISNDPLNSISTIMVDR